MSGNIGGEALGEAQLHFQCEATIRGLEAENAGLELENAVVEAENARLRAQIDGTDRVCSVCGGPWGLERPLCDYSKGGRCEGGYIMTKQAFDAIQGAISEASR